MKLFDRFIKTINESSDGQLTGAGGSAGGGALPQYNILSKRRKQKLPTKDQPLVDIRQITTENTLIKYYNVLKEAPYPGNSTDQSIADQSNGQDENAINAGVLSKLKAMERRDSQDMRDTITFGLEDENDQIVRVVVKQQQAAEFERAIQSILYGQSEQARPEIAEVLFDLKDSFDIVDIIWPEIEEDEQQEVVEPTDDQLSDQPPLDDIEPADDTGQVQSLLTQVIDMMKADAEARSKEAEARAKEADVRIADNIARQAALKVRQEEQILDMETQEKTQREEDKEAKRLAQLSRWKNQIDQDQSDTDFSSIISPGEVDHQEDEQQFTRRKLSTITPSKVASTANLRGKVNPAEIASFLLNRVAR